MAELAEVLFWLFFPVFLTGVLCLIIQALADFIAGLR